MGQILHCLASTIITSHPAAPPIGAIDIRAPHLAVCRRLPYACIWPRPGLKAHTELVVVPTMAEFLTIQAGSRAIAEFASAVLIT